MTVRVLRDVRFHVGGPENRMCSVRVHPFRPSGEDIRVRFAFGFWAIYLVVEGLKTS